MLKVILKTFLGLLVCVLGFSFGFFYLIKIDDSWAPLLLIPTLLLVIFGGFVLMRAGKSEATVIKKPDLSKDITKVGLEDVFAKNSELSSKWSKTVEKRDKLKLLQISSAAEDQAE